jgi:hypothetical protein
MPVKDRVMGLRESFPTATLHLMYVTTLGLYTKFIKAKREHKCGKIQVSPPFSGP